MITVSAKSEYGLSFLAYLAKNEGRVVSLAEVAEKEMISKGYLEEVASGLKTISIGSASETSKPLSILFLTNFPKGVFSSLNLLKISPVAINGIFRFSAIYLPIVLFPDP